MSKYTSEQLKAAVNQAYSKKQSLTKLGLELDIYRGTLRKVAKELGLDFGKFRGVQLNPNLLTGKTFGKLLVEGFAGRNEKGALWNCLCVCGKRKVVAGGYLHRKTSPITSCGCLQYPKGSKSLHWKGHGALPSNKFSQIKGSARKRSIEFNLTIEDAYKIFQKQNGICALSGLEISLDSDCKDKFTRASLDRIDSNEGYKITNVQWVSQAVNLMKHAFSTEDFIRLCRLIAKHNKIK